MDVTNIGYDFRHTGAFYMSRPNGSGDFLLLILKTQAYFILNGQKVIAKPNSAIIYRPSTPQHYGIVGDVYVDDWVHFRCSEEDIAFFDRLRLPLDTVLEIGDLAMISQLIKYMFYERYSVNECRDESVQMYCRLLMIKIAERYQMTLASHSDAYYEKMSYIRARIYSMPEKNWCVEDLAQELFLSVSYFQSLYKKHFGVSVMTDVINSRIEHSKYLLVSTDYLLNHISELCGYKNSVHFMRQFKRTVGVTPTEYRTKLKVSKKEISDRKKLSPYFE